jgi:hypothetical protein
MTDREWGDYISNIFFPERGKSNESAPFSQAICDSCPVKDECLSYSFDIAESDWMAAYFPRGVWGGQSQRKREQMLSKMGGRRPH